MTTTRGPRTGTVLPLHSRGSTVVAYVAVAYAMVMGFVLTLVYASIEHGRPFATVDIINSSASHWVWASLAAIGIGSVLTVAARRTRHSRR
ncbi:hypothetical protein [Williamsia sterculiae]|uniref:Uncharacterized protein n=1 Tax=Williamsia sterculiae TaxID=1344003 RepID=A0A1N7F5R3_9NOCA|nr:hypothetical protein [Williamsia sterculiae]SIR95606.1 hypothetical protein SAMN05445060_1829 [Williamsia sterculiae]